MSEHRDRQPGDLILDHYLPDATSEQREEARAQLYAFVNWQMRILVHQVQKEQMDSREEPARDTLDSAPPSP